MTTTEKIWHLVQVLSVFGLWLAGQFLVLDELSYRSEMRREARLRPKRATTKIRNQYRDRMPRKDRTRR